MTTGAKKKLVLITAIANKIAARFGDDRYKKRAYNSLINTYQPFIIYCNKGVAVDAALGRLFLGYYNARNALLVGLKEYAAANGIDYRDASEVDRRSREFIEGRGRATARRKLAEAIPAQRKSKTRKPEKPQLKGKNKNAKASKNRNRSAK